MFYFILKYYTTTQNLYLIHFFLFQGECVENGLGEVHESYHTV